MAGGRRLGYEVYPRRQPAARQLQHQVRANKNLVLNYQIKIYHWLINIAWICVGAISNTTNKKKTLIWLKRVKLSVFLSIVLTQEIKVELSRLLVCVLSWTIWTKTLIDTCLACTVSPLYQHASLTTIKTLTRWRIWTAVTTICSTQCSAHSVKCPQKTKPYTRWSVHRVWQVCVVVFFKDTSAPARSSGTPPAANCNSEIGRQNETPSDLCTPASTSLDKSSARYIPLPMIHTCTHGFEPTTTRR
jgi:hypothetical protein